MELALIQKENFHKIIKEEDDFFYPLLFNSSLLQSRFIGKQLRVKLRNGFEVKGIFLGEIRESLNAYIKKHSHFKESPSFLEFDSPTEWLGASLKSRFDGVRFFTQKSKGPFSVTLQEMNGFLLFAAFSEAEQEDLPEINYNLVITNDAIDRLASFVKHGLPKVKKEKHAVKKQSEVSKQLGLGRFTKK